MCLIPNTLKEWLRTIIPLVLLGSGVLGWILWNPGEINRSGNHDLGKNGLFMSHQWLASDTWFNQSKENMAQLAQFRGTPQVIASLQDLKNKGIGHVFLDLSPCEKNGALPQVSYNGTEMFGYQATALKIHAWPWVGGTQGKDCFVENPEWRKSFIASCNDVLTKCPHLSGVLVNIDPWPQDDASMLLLLDELRMGLPKDKKIAVAACPPPTLFQNDRNSHWDEAYFKQVANKSDLMVVLLMNTGIKNEKFFKYTMASWTQKILQWAGKTPVLLTIGNNPSTPSTLETLPHALAGIHAGLSSLKKNPSYEGIALYADFTLPQSDWAIWEKEFCAKRPQIEIQKPPTLEDLMQVIKSKNEK